MAMRNIYRELAKQDGVPVKEIQREMQAAIEMAGHACPADGVTSAYQRRVPSKSTVPSVEEFICYASGQAVKRV